MLPWPSHIPCWSLLCWGAAREAAVGQRGSSGAGLPCSAGDCTVAVTESLLCLPQAAEPRAWHTVTARTPRLRCRSSWAQWSPSPTPQAVAGQLCSLLVSCCSQRLLQLVWWGVARWFVGFTRELCRKCLLISSRMQSDNHHLDDDF